MIKNYIKIAWRNLVGQKFYSVLNVLGLTVGIASCLLIVLYIQHELSYDRYHANASKIHRVAFKGMMNGSLFEIPIAGAPTGETMQRELPEVKAFTRINRQGSTFATHEDKSFKEHGVMYADPSFFEVFSVSLLSGDVRTVLNEPNTVVVSQAIANKYFGNENPVGKTLKLDSYGGSVIVTGVFKEVSDNSHFKFDMLVSMLGNEGSKTSDGWLSMNYFTYLVLEEGATAAQVEAKLPDMVERYMGPEVIRFLGVNLDEFRAKGNSLGLYLQPLTDIHLHSSHFMQDIEPQGDIKYVYIFAAIALFVLLIACINFMNLSTARSARRAKEVGIRKALGSLKEQLITQFITESVLLTLLAALIAVFVVEASLPFFSAITGKKLVLTYFGDATLVLTLLSICVLVGLIAGSYPAFYLSSFKPVAVLKGQVTKSKSSSTLRSSLVVFQFAISMGLIVATTVVYQQLNYIQNKKVGYDREHVLVLQDTYLLNGKEAILKEYLKQDPQVVNASISAYIPAGQSNSYNTVFMPEENQSQPTQVRVYQVDADYIPTYGIQLAEGRNFSPQYATDSQAVLINQAAARAYGWQDPLNRKVVTFGEGDTRIAYTVIGVIEDFHFESLHSRIAPMVMTYGQAHGSISVKVKGEDIPATLARIESKWREIAPYAAFSYSFLDDRFLQTYETEQKTGTIFGFFSLLGIFIACLGLLGLAAFTAEQRTKEIGIRKVLGASSAGIVAMLSKDFLKLVILAILVATPVAWYAMNRWLDDYAYRTDLSVSTFAIAGGIALLIAFATVSFQALKAARTNPVKSLRSE
jgi:putative ABC transport system permease protein